MGQRQITQQKSELKDLRALKVSLGCILMVLRLISCAPVELGPQCSNGCQGCEGHPVWHSEVVYCLQREAEWTVFQETLKLAMDIIQDRENVLSYPGE